MMLTRKEILRVHTLAQRMSVSFNVKDSLQWSKLVKKLLEDLKKRDK